MSLKDIINHLRTTVPEPIPKEGVIDVAFLIYTFLKNDKWNSEDLELFNQIEEKLDINKKLFSFYSLQWKKTGHEILSEPWQSIFTLMIYQTFLIEKKIPIEDGKLYKKANVLLKSLDISKADWLHMDTSLYQSIHEDIISFIKSNIKQARGSEFIETSHYDQGKPFRILPLTVLFYEGPVGRAYLETLYSMGLRPERIIHLVSSTDITTRKPLGVFLPGRLRKLYAAYIQKIRIHFWPKYIGRAIPALKSSLIKKVAGALNFSEDVLYASCTNSPLKKYAGDIDTLLVAGLNDKKLLDYLAGYAKTAVLYTGGGIMPDSLLAIRQIRFIHIHPGFLPEIRGSDCFLWSNLLASRPSVSCFYMTTGIDLGNIIFSTWLPIVSINFDTKGYDLKILYRAVYAFIDPWVRCYALRILISSNKDYTDIPSYSQTDHEGITYHFMHPGIQKALFES